MVVIFIRLVYHDATLVRLELEVTDTILLDVLHHTEGHGDRYIGSLFRVDEPVPDDSGAAQWPRARCPRSQSLADVIPLRFLRFPYQSWRQR